MTKFLKLAVFTDLDGTLLDHNTYSWDAARPALDRLVRLQCLVVLASSKTAAEVLALQDIMALSGQPALVENGSGLIGSSMSLNADIVVTIFAPVFASWVLSAVSLLPSRLKASAQPSCGYSMAVGIGKRPCHDYRICSCFDH